LVLRPQILSTLLGFSFPKPWPSAGNEEKLLSPDGSGLPDTLGEKWLFPNGFTTFSVALSILSVGCVFKDFPDLTPKDSETVRSWMF
jgi:hypothetical protein